jgi:thioredoxin 1
MKTAKYFTAAWCGPCKMFKPVIQEVVSEGHSIEILDIDKNQALAAKYNVMSIPTIVIEDNDVEVDRLTGATTKDDLIRRLNT